MSQVKRLLAVFAIVLVSLVGVGSSAGAAGYNWKRANIWALYHAQDQQPNFNGCAWFVSNALWYGGLTPDTGWHNNAVRPSKSGIVPGTKTATVAGDLYRHLTGQRSMRTVNITDRYQPGNTAIPEARPGDVIAYDWDGGRQFEPTHVAIVVHIGANYYPEVAEWGSAPDGKTSPYQFRGWSWSANHNAWQKKVEPAVRAVLVQIR